MNIVEPGGSFCFCKRFFPTGIGHAPAPPYLRPWRQRSTLTHFPCPFRMDGFPRCELWKRLGYHFPAILLLAAILQNNGTNFYRAAHGELESNCFREIQDNFIFGYVCLRSGLCRKNSQQAEA